MHHGKSSIDKKGSALQTQQLDCGMRHRNESRTGRHCLEDQRQTQDFWSQQKQAHLDFQAHLGSWLKQWLLLLLLLSRFSHVDSVRPQRQQPNRLLCPWNSPGKNTGVGCHFLLQRMKVKSEREVTQSCPTLRDPMDCSLPGSSIHGIFQARVLEWVAIAFSQTVASLTQRLSQELTSW